MGNCCRPGRSSMVWPGHDWGDSSSAAAAEEPKISHQNTAASSSYAHSSSNNYPGAVRQVKIKITRKELQELLDNASVQGIPVEQVLARLVIDKIGNGHHRVVEQLLHRQHRPWKPALNSIPE